MPQQQTVQNSFKEGLKTEFTGLNFPENAATDTQNCVYSYIGDVSRRGGINYETNFALNSINQTGVAKSSFKWLNAGGDGQTQVLVQQIGNTLYFFQYTNATTTSPISTTLLASTVTISNYQAIGNVANVALTECQYAQGNGYLFVFHSACDSFYCTFNAGVITAAAITIQIRDFVGIPEPGVPDNFRPSALTIEHQYNLTNQGWTAGSPWSATDNTAVSGTSNVGVITASVGQSFTVPITNQTNTTSVSNGKTVAVSSNVVPGQGGNISATVLGTVTAYSTPFTTITLNIFSSSYPASSGYSPGLYFGGVFYPPPDFAYTLNMYLVDTGFVNTWFTAIGNYPSNSDVWWLYKNTSDSFSPSTMFANVQQNIGAAPKGTYILNAFRQLRSTVSGISGLTDITTAQRPSTGTFFAGRVWYAGVNDSFQSTYSTGGDAPYTTWTENIYFSQIITNPTQFGKCYQVNDPTSENTFDILSSDGGVITIPGCGAIYKLFALRYGILVFAANGIWFISGSTGVGFQASDYTITKISNIENISGTSFIEVQGYPFFWNQEGIYQVVPSKDAGSAHSPDIQLDVKNLTIGSILSYYNNVPILSKGYARGDYDMLNYIVQWCFRSTTESGINNRYTYDTILNYNVITGAFYPFTLPSSTSVISDIKYIQNPGAITSPNPVLKYLTSNGNSITFSEENDFTNYLDFFSESGVGYNYISYFTSGYNLPGQALRKIQVPYVYIFTRNPTNTSMSVQAIWDFAGSPTLGSVDANSGKWSTRQRIYFNQTDFTMAYRKVRLRGRGMAVQIRVSSIQGQPFDIMGWSILDQVNQVV